VKVAVVFGIEVRFKGLFIAADVNLNLGIFPRREVASGGDVPFASRW
jgi:hypothetical protein